MVATAALLFAINLIGLRLFPPWWATWGFGVFLVLAVLLAWRRRFPFVSMLPVGWLDWFYTVVLIAIGSWGMYQSAGALAGRAPQTGTIVELAFPLRSREYLVVSAGSHLSLNPHLMTLDASTVRFQAYRGQSYGVDIVKLNSWGLRASGLLPPDPSAYYIYSEPVYAPCTGEIIAAQDGLPDMQVALLHENVKEYRTVFNTVTPSTNLTNGMAQKKPVNRI